MDSDPGFGVASEVIRIVVEPNTFMIIGGTALGEYTQRLTILREADEWQLIGLQKVLICDRTRRCLSFAPVEKTVTYILLFESASQGSEFVESEYTRDFKSTKHIIPNFATYYTIHTENGSDDRFPDITLSVALIAATKGGTASNSRDDKLNSHPGMNPDEPEPILEPCTRPTGLRPFILTNKYETSPTWLRPFLLKGTYKGLRPFILARKYKTWGMAA